MTIDESPCVTFCCDNLWNSNFLALEKPEKLREFFSYFVATLLEHLVITNCHDAKIQ